MISPQKLTYEVCDVECERLYDSVGKQDQYTAPLGGLPFNHDSVSADPVICQPEIRHELNRRLLMFCAGIRHRATGAWAHGKAKFADHGDALRHICEIACELSEVLGQVAPRGLAGRTAIGYYERALDSGAPAGKVLGARSGGFLLVYASRTARRTCARNARNWTKLASVWTRRGSRRCT